MIKPVHIAGVGSAIRPRRQQILVVEDNDDQWFLTRWAILRTEPDMQVVRTSNTLDTMGYLASCLYDHRPLPTLILLDLYLPDREEGWALLESIKLHHTLRRIPVIILSNSASREDVEQSYYLRVASYMVKPTSYPEWLDCFDNFRRYWLQSVTLPPDQKRPVTGPGRASLWPLPGTGHPALRWI